MWSYFVFYYYLIGDKLMDHQNNGSWLHNNNQNDYNNCCDKILNEKKNRKSDDKLSTWDLTHQNNKIIKYLLATFLCQILAWSGYCIFFPK